MISREGQVAGPLICSVWTERPCFTPASSGGSPHYPQVWSFTEWTQSIHWRLSIHKCDLLQGQALVTQSCLTFCNPMDCSPPGFSVHGNSSGKSTGVGSHSLLQGIFPIQGLNLGLLHCRQILYWLRNQGSPFSAVTVWPETEGT